MTGVIIQAVPKREVTYDGVEFGTQEIVLADRVNVIHWRMLTLLVKVYSHSLASGAGTIAIGVYPQTTSEDEPNVDFLEKTVLYGPVLDGAVAAPSYFAFGLPLEGESCFGPLLRLVARGIRTAGGAMSATIAVDIAAKSV